jgi:hypothetical protein
MASSSKKRTTMAKLAREHKLRERRIEKQARRDARRFAAADASPGGEAEPPAPSDRDPLADDGPAAADETASPEAD